VKTRTASETSLERPEDAVNLEKGHNPARIARRFLQQRRSGKVPWRFELLATDSPRGSRPEVRLHKGAFAGSGEVA
jgi:Holliday junction resolvase-like predicted endonuclease